MNYLAHALLAGEDLGFLLGGMAGDFFKGRPEGIPDRPLQCGVRLHRRIDAFTDAHPLCARSRRRIPGPRRRYAGIIVDVVYDHFLARHWSRFGGQTSLERFSAGVYHALTVHRARLPPAFRELVPRMREHDWLGSYRHLERVGGAIDRISDRLRQGAALRGALVDIESAYPELEADFLRFFPVLAEFAREERRRLSSAAQSDAICPVPSGDRHHPTP